MNKSINIMHEKKYLEPAVMVDSSHPLVVKCAKSLISEGDDAVLMAVKLYYFVRDEICYDPYTHFHKPEYYKASRTLTVKSGNCICKAVLLCALARAVNIPSRLGFADVKNHLATKKLLEFIGSEIFLFHGYTELFLNRKWVISTPAFNLELCKRHNVDPLEFDGLKDSIFQPYNLENKIFMEYVTYHGSFCDVPLDLVLSAWRKGYGEKRVMSWETEIERKQFYFK